MFDIVDRNRVPLKQYSLIVTGTNWTTSRAVGVPYQTTDGSWRLRFNITGAFSGAASAPQAPPLQIAGISSNMFQAVSVANSVNLALPGLCGMLYTDSGIYIIWSSSQNFNQNWAVSGDVVLASKPTFVQE